MSVETQQESFCRLEVDGEFCEPYCVPFSENNSTAQAEEASASPGATAASEGGAENYTSGGALFGAWLSALVAALLLCCCCAALALVLVLRRRRARGAHSVELRSVRQSRRSYETSSLRKNRIAVR